MTFGAYGITDYQVQYWNGSSWQTVTGGNVTGNNKVCRKFTFADITTSKIRVYVTHAAELYSYVTEIEAYQSGGSGSSYTYDSAGNVTNDGLHSYGYDSENRIVSVDGGSTASYAYDHQNRRYKNTVGSTVTHYVWQGLQVLAEHNGGTGAVITDYVYSGNRMIAKVSGGTMQTFLSDRLSTRLTLDNTLYNSGNVLGRQAHLPFGEDFAESGTQEKHHLTSYERDSENGTDYAVNRQYSQGVGRFGSADKYRSSGGVADPQSWNRYSYARNNAVNRVDPSGLEDFSAETSIIPGWTWNGFICAAFPELCGERRPPLGDGEENKPEPPRTACGDWLSRFVFGPDDAKLAEAVFSEFSGDIQEGVAIAFVIKNRLWFLSHTINNTLGLGPRNATIEQVLGTPGAFPEYQANGALRPAYQRLFDFAWNSNIGSAPCDRLINAYTIVSAVNDGGYRDPFAAQGGGWFFQQGRSSPCPICQFLGKLGVHNFWTIPYTDYTGGVKAPWY